jgi:HEAT repeat protein
MLEVDSTDDARYLSIEQDVSRTSEQLLGDLSDESWRIRRLAIERLVERPDATDLVEPLLNKLNLRHGTALRNAAASVLDRLGTSAVDRVSARLASNKADERKFLVEILGHIGGQRAEQALIAATGDSDVNVSSAAIEALGNFSSPEAARAIHRHLNSRFPMVCVATLEALAQLGSAPSLQSLWPHLENPYTRRSAFKVLGLVQHTTTICRTAQALAKRETREAGVLGLSLVSHEKLLAPQLVSLAHSVRKNPDAIDFVTRLLTSDFSAQQSASLESAKPDSALQRGALVLAQALAAPELALAVCAAAPAHEAEAAQVLASLGEAGAMTLLTSGDALLELPNAGRAVAHEHLIRWSSPALVSSLVAWLDHGDEELVHIALTSLGRSRSSEALAPLQAALGDARTIETAASACVELGLYFRIEIQAALSKQLDVGWHPALVRAAAQLGNIALIQEALSHRDEVFRAAAAESARLISLEALHSALFDESALVRRSAARGVLQLSLEEAGPILPRLLADLDNPVKVIGCRAVVQYRAESLVGTLDRLTKSSDASVVAASLQSIAELGSATVELLLELAQHPDPTVAKTALVMGAAASEIVELSERLLSSTQWELRAAASEVLGLSASQVSPQLEIACQLERHPVVIERLRTARRLISLRT